MMPTFLGRPLYPGGAPLHPANIFWQDLSVREMFILHAEEKADEDQINFLKEYVIYYINAPFFQLPEDYKEEHLLGKSLDEMLEELLDWNLDPF